MLFVQRRTSPCVGIRWVTTFNLTLFNPEPSRVLFFSHPTWKNPWGMIEGGQTNQWRSYLLFRKKAKWRPWQSLVGEAANRLGCRRGSSRANRRDGGHSTAGSVGQANLCVCLYCGHACAAYNTPVSPCTRLFGTTGHLQIKHGSSNTSTNWGHCETNKQTSLFLWLALLLIKAACLRAKCNEVNPSKQRQLMWFFIYFFWFQFCLSFLPYYNIYKYFLIKSTFLPRSLFHQMLQHHFLLWGRNGAFGPVAIFPRKCWYEWRREEKTNTAMMGHKACGRHS